MPDVKPQQLGVPEKEPVIYTIPDQFYGVAAKAKVPVEKPAPPAAPAVAPAAPTAPKPAGGKKWLLIPIVATVLLALSGGAVWYFVLRKPAKPAPKAAVTLTPPAPEPVPEEAPAPEEVPAPPVEEATTTEPTPAPEPVPAPPPGTPDADNDGLSDAEESLYGTNAQSADSDGDGFSDSVEVVNLYNPAGFKPTRLIEAGLVQTYASSPGGFEMLYPSAWARAEEDGNAIAFSNPQNEPITVAVEDNPQDQSVLDWYLSRNPGVSPVQVVPFYTKSGLEGVRSPDGLTAAISGKGKIFVVTYAPTVREAANFRSTFTMMVNSFVLKP